MSPPGRRADKPGDRERFDKLFTQGNYKDAYEGYRGLALDPKTEPDRVGTDLRRAIQCLVQLGRVDEVDAFREAVVAVHQANWRLLQAAAESYLNDAQHSGFIVAGKFHRGRHRGGGRYVGSYERDRSRALQLLVQRAGSCAVRPRSRRGGPLLSDARPGPHGQPDGSDSWRLQSLTPLDVLADYDENPYASLGRPASRCAPVEPDGTPVYYRVPESFEKAKNDGERWRWALAQAAEADPGLLNTTRSDLAGFLLEPVRYPDDGGIGVRRRVRPKAVPKPSGPYALDTLAGRRDDRPARHRHQAVQAPR